LASKAPTNLGNVLRAASMSYASVRACQGVGKWHGGHGCRYCGWSLILRASSMTKLTRAALETRSAILDEMLSTEYHS